VFFGMGTSSNAEVLARMMDFIERLGTVTATQLMNQFSPDLEDAEHLIKLLKTLMMKKFITRTPSQNGIMTTYIFNKDSEN